MAEPLSLPEIRFCRLWLEHDENASAAYRDAKFPGVSEGSVGEMASRLLKKVEIQEYISELREQASDAAKITIEKIAQGLSHIAFANRGDLYDEDGTLKHPRDWPKDVAATVEGIETEELFETVSEKGQPKRRELKGHTRKVKTARRTEALKTLAQWKKMVDRSSELEAMAAEITQLRQMIAKLMEERKDAK
jgi:phage terminase small subunit